MSRRTLNRTWWILAVAVLVGAVAAGGVVASQRGGAVDTEALMTAIENEPMTQVAEIAAAEGAPARGVYVQLTSTGHFCVWDAPSARSRMKQGGCNAADDLLGGQALSVSLAYDGGPSASSVTGARLFGLAAPEVDRVEVLLRDGTARRVKLRDGSFGGVRFRAFGYRLTRAEIRKAGGPSAVVALDVGGSEIDRQDTGFGQ